MINFAEAKISHNFAMQFIWINIFWPQKKVELNRFSKLMELSRNLHKQIGREC